MSFLDFFKGGKEEVSSAQAAKDRLSVIVASNQQLSTRLDRDKIERMKREILEVVNCYVHGVSLNDVNITTRMEQNIELLEMNINLPDSR